MNIAVRLPSMLVARSAQMAADSIGSIDAQARAIAAISVDGSVLPNLAADVAALNRTMAAWPQSIRGQTIAVLGQAVAFDSQIEASWGSVPQDNQAALVAFARVLAAGVSQQEAGVGQLESLVAPFRMAVDKSVSTLKSDLQALGGRIAAEQQRAASLAQQVHSQQARIDDYKDHPWKLILDGVSIVGLAMDLANIISANNAANSALSELHRVQAQLAQLSAAQGPLLTLSLAVTGLSGGVSNIQTALSQMSNTLNDMIATPMLPAIMSAQLGAMIQDLASARAIAGEVLAGS
jgi:hypothetical protein